MSASPRFSNRQWPWLLVLLSGAVAAQTTPAEKPKEEGAPPAIQLRFVSALKDYKPYTDQPVQNWREANDQVERKGGWRAYAKETLKTEAPKAVAPADAHAEHNQDGKK